METLKEIIGKYNYRVEFPVMGNTLVISPERNIYHNLRRKYNELANKSEAVFRDFLSSLTNLDELLSCVPDAFVAALEKGLDEISRDAISVGLISLDAESIVEECLKGGYFDAFQKAYNK